MRFSARTREDRTAPYGGHDWASLCETVRPSCTCAMRKHSNVGPPSYVEPTPTSPGARWRRTT